MQNLNIEMFVHGYFIFALGYNVVSQLSLEFVGKKFAPTDPIFGLLMVSVVYVLYLIKPLVAPFPVLFIASLFILAILRFGIIQHLMNYSADEYLSRSTWAAAFSINFFGVIVLTIAFFTG